MFTSSSGPPRGALSRVASSRPTARLSVGRSQDAAACRLHVPVGVLDHDVLCEADERGPEIALVPRAHLARHGMVLVLGHRHTILPRHRRPQCAPTQ